jgi:hypothetical protein
VQSGEVCEIPNRGCRGAPTPKEQRTDNDFTAQRSFPGQRVPF